MASEQIVYNIIAKDQASKKFKDLGDAADKSGKRISGGFSKIGLLAGGAAAVIGGLGAAGVVMGIKTAAALEQANIGFTTLLGSSKAAGAYVKDLQKFAANTPFEFQGLVDSSRLLLGVGVSAKQVIPMLTDFGDAAGALGIQQDAFQRIMLASSQAISAGKFQVGDINQIVQAGIPVWSLLSKSLGKPVSALRKMSSQGKLTADVVLPALQRQMHKDYGGSMAKQSQTLAGLWSTFTDTLSQGLAKAMLPLVPMLKSILPGAMNFMGVALGGLAKGLQLVIGGVQHIVTWFRAGKGSAGELSTAFSGLVHWVTGQLAPALKSFAVAVLPQVKQLLTAVTGAVRDNHQTFVVLGKFITGVLIPVVKFLAGQALAALIRQIKVGSAVLHGVVSAVSSVVTAFGNMKRSLAGSKLGAVIAAPFKVALVAINAAISAAHTLDNLLGTPHTSWKVYKTPVGSQGPSSVGRRAAGGPVRAGSPYVVGENGPELFVPGQSGGIVPNGGGSKSAVGGNTYNIHMSGMVGDKQALARTVIAAIQDLTRATGKPAQIRVAG